jgi:DNA-binding SARP family transcriptional activator/TolB-like protein
LIRFRLLGAPDLRGDEASELRGVLTQPRLLSLLTYLALARPRGFHRRDSLIGMFWPEMNQGQARNALRQVVHRLRRTLGEGVVVSRGAEELGIDPTRIWCDVVACEDALTAGDVPGALELYRGDLLPGFFLSDAPAFEYWLEGERARLRQWVTAAAWDLSEQEAAAGRPSHATQWARWAVGLAPDDEGAFRRLIELMARLGDRSGAVRAYEAFARRLAQDLEVEPSAETQAMVAALRQPEPTRSSDPRQALAGVEASGAESAASEATTPPSPPGPTRQRHRSMAAMVGLALLALGAVAVWMVRPREAPRPPLQAIAVFPFAVRGSPDLAYLREGMVDLLSAKLEGASWLHAIDPRSVVAAVESRGNGTTPTGDAAVRITRSLGAGWYIGGDVVEIAGRLQVSGVLYDVQGDPRVVGTASVEGETSNLFQLVDDLTGQVLASLASGRDTAIMRLAAVTTRSLPALKAYLEGEQALRDGLDAQAAAAFRKAAILDTGFALAQYRLALSATWATVTNADSIAMWAASAARHAQRLTPLLRDLLTAYTAYRAVDTQAAERLYLSLTEGYPDNVEAWFMLGEIRFHFEPWRGRSPLDARPAFQRVLALDPGNAHAMIHLARLAAMEGRTADLDSLARRYLDRHHEADRTVEMRALQAFLGRDPAGWGAVAAEAQRTEAYTDISVLDGAVAYAQNLDAARALAPAIVSLREPVSRRLGLRLLSDLGLAGGQWSRDAAAGLLGPAVDDEWLFESRILMAADPFFPVPRSAVAALRDTLAARSRFTAVPHPALQPDGELGGLVREYFLGLLSVRLGDGATADRYARELSAVPAGSRAGPAASLAHGLAAEIARTHGQMTRALAELDGFDFQGSPPAQTMVLHWGTHERFLRAEVLLALGRDREAVPWYDSFHISYDLPFMAAAHLRLGQIEQRLGNLERARFHLTRFLSLWNDCDPEFRPMVRNAERVLAQLEGHS